MHKSEKLSEFNIMQINLGLSDMLGLLRCIAEAKKAGDKHNIDKAGGSLSVDIGRIENYLKFIDALNSSKGSESVMKDKQKIKLILSEWCESQAESDKDFACSVINMVEDRLLNGGRATAYERIYFSLKDFEYENNRLKSYEKDLSDMLKCDDETFLKNYYKLTFKDFAIKYIENRLKDPDYICILGVSISTIQAYMINILPELKNCPPDKFKEFLTKYDLNGRILYKINVELRAKKDFLVKYMQEDYRAYIADKEKILKSNKRLFNKNKHDFAMAIECFPDISGEVREFVARKTRMQKLLSKFNIKGERK
ncbi:MAG: hypothetical protein LBF28_00210 [Rickettsiales bacterium]|nr:hypothetical protein [Rickettsiales bacterium]